jgi:hypothetical protein
MGTVATCNNSCFPNKSWQWEADRLVGIHNHRNIRQLVFEHLLAFIIHFLNSRNTTSLAVAPRFCRLFVTQADVSKLRCDWMRCSVLIELHIAPFHSACPPTLEGYSFDKTAPPCEPIQMSHNAAPRLIGNSSNRVSVQDVI